MNVYVGVEGYTLPSGFILKELVIMFPNTEYSHYIFEKPNDIVLSPQDAKTVRYATRNLNSLNYEDGDISYNQLGTILDKLKDFTIYTYSLIASNLIQKFLPTTVVINSQNLGQKLPKHLPNPNCFRLHQNYRYCAKAKSYAVRNFIEYEHHRRSGAEQDTEL